MKISGKFITLRSRNHQDVGCTAYTRRNSSEWPMLSVELNLKKAENDERIDVVMSNEEATDLAIEIMILVSQNRKEMVKSIAE